MQPYYDRDGITIYCGDCRDVLPTLARGSVDLLLTDPPYGVRWQSGRRRDTFARIVGDDGSLDVPAALATAIRLLKHHRHVYLFGSPDIAALPLCSPVELIWDKEIPGAGNLTLPWSRSHEPITFAVYSWSPVERGQGAGRLAARLRQGSVLRYPRPSGAAVTRHPTEKPVPLLRQLIESSSILGETVLDPFMGVGSTLVAAQLEGRQAIGIEIDEGYCETAAKRLDAARQAPLPLDVGA